MLRGLADLDATTSTRRGVEQVEESSGNSEITVLDGAKCGALSINSPPILPDLAKVIKAWPALSEDARSSVLRLIRGETD